MSLSHLGAHQSLVGKWHLTQVLPSLYEEVKQTKHLMSLAVGGARPHPTLRAHFFLKGLQVWTV